MSDFRLAIFDWDGTLVDSIGRIVDSLRLAAQDCTLPALDELALRSIIGLALPEAVQRLYPAQNLPESLVKQFCQSYSTHYSAREHQPSPLFPGALALLQELRAKGFVLAVATGKSRRGLNEVLAGRGWLDYFDITRCADETRGKPHPLMLEEILSYSGCTRQQAFMVGDSPFDLHMAHNAQVTAVAVGHGAVSLRELKQHRPHLAIEHFDQLKRWLWPAHAMSEGAVDG